MSAAGFAPTRRGFLAGAGAFTVAFSLGRPALGQEGEVQGAGGGGDSDLPGSLGDTPRLDSWIRVGADGAVTVFTGKAELGQGVRTALLQVAAEELEVDPATVEFVTADTGRTPNEGYTAGSQSLSNSGTALRHAAAQVRELLLDEAGRRFGAAREALAAESGAVVLPDGRRIPYGELVGDTLLAVDAAPQSRLKAPEAFRLVGRSMPRVDIPAKVTGAPAYVHDLRLPGMVHARMVRPPAPGARLMGIEDEAAIRALPGVVLLHRDGDLLAVAATREWQAVKAMRRLSASARWSEPETALPTERPMAETLRALAVEDGIVVDTQVAPAGVAQTYRATFSRPFQLHGSIGPSCAVALFENGAITVWTHTQGVFPDRDAIAEMLGMPEGQVRCIHMEGAGCYGHNGADDAAADAALLARALPGRPVRVQWTREQEHAHEPYGPAMTADLEADLTADGRIAGWRYDVWSPTHTTRPGPAGNLLAARHLAAPFAPEVPQLEITRSGNGDRNSDPYYAIESRRVVWHFVRDSPLRVSALRALGAYANVFAIESAMDELAIMAGADPVEFRLRHLSDPRARAVVERAADGFGWSGEPLPKGHGRGFAFGRYKNYAAYLALAVEVSVEPESGRVALLRASAAIDSGEAVNPDGIRNQTEGGILQAASWTLHEAVSFDRNRVTSIDWSSYPILRFDGVPARIDVEVMERPGEPFLGTGEGAQGPTPAALGNAVRAAIGHRVTDLPFTRERIRALTAGS